MTTDIQALIADLRRASRETVPVTTGVNPATQSTYVRDLHAEAADALAALSPAGGRPPEEAVAWRPVESAPKDGTHFLAADFTRGAVGFGYFHGHMMAQPMMTVVHYYTNGKDVSGFYTSVNELEPQRPFYFTDWMPLPDKRQSNGVNPMEPK